MQIYLASNSAFQCNYRHWHLHTVMFLHSEEIARLSFFPRLVWLHTKQASCHFIWSTVCEERLNFHSCTAVLPWCQPTVFAVTALKSARRDVANIETIKWILPAYISGEAQALRNLFSQLCWYESKDRTALLEKMEAHWAPGIFAKLRLILSPVILQNLKKWLHWIINPRILPRTPEILSKLLSLASE